MEDCILSEICAVGSEQSFIDISLSLTNASQILYIQNALIGMDAPLSVNRRLAGAEFTNFEGGLVDGVPFDDYYFEVRSRS